MENGYSDKINKYNKASFYTTYFRDTNVEENLKLHGISYLSKQTMASFLQSGSAKQTSSTGSEAIHLYVTISFTKDRSQGNSQENTSILLSLGPSTQFVHTQNVFDLKPCIWLRQRLKPGRDWSIFSCRLAGSNENLIV